MLDRAIVELGLKGQVSGHTAVTVDAFLGPLVERPKNGVLVLHEAFGRSPGEGEHDHFLKHFQPVQDFLVAELRHSSCSLVTVHPARGARPAARSNVSGGATSFRTADLLQQRSRAPRVLVGGSKQTRCRDGVQLGHGAAMARHGGMLDGLSDARVRLAVVHDGNLIRRAAAVTEIERGLIS